MCIRDSSLTKSKIADPILKNKLIAEGVAKAHPMKRVGEGKDAAAMAQFLLSEDSSSSRGLGDVYKRQTINSDIRGKLSC